MPSALTHREEKGRLAALASYQVLDTFQEKEFDDLTSLASAICQVPIALITLVDEKRQWFKSHTGTDISETPIELSFCAHAIVSPDDMTIVEDAHEDERFKDNPLVTGDPHIVFYAGVPLVNEDGYSLGTLCIIDLEKRRLSDEQKIALKVLAKQVMDKLELNRKMLALEVQNKLVQDLNHDLSTANDTLVAANNTLVASNEKLNLLNEHIKLAQDELLEVNVQLTKKENILRLAVESADLALWNFESDTRKLYLSDDYRRMHGLDLLCELSFTDIMGIIDPSSRQQFSNAIDLAVEKQQQIIDLEYQVIHPVTSQRRWIKVSGKLPAIQNALSQKETGGRTVFLCVAHDITDTRHFADKLTAEVKERTKDLNRSNEDLLQFAHVASHDLKEPVRKIKTFANRLHKESGDALSVKGQEYLTKIQHATERMYKMIDGVLAYSEVNTSQQTVEKIDLNETITDICSDLEVAIAGKKATISKDILPVIEGAPALIHQLFYNLIGNALKFSSGELDPAITISHIIVFVGDIAVAKIFLKDNGIGFDQVYADKIFNTFTRLHSKDAFEGTGLGLALCKKIVSRHHGSIEAVGVPGKGCTFTIMLPVQQHQHI